MLIHPRLVRIQIQLAHGADGDDHVGVIIGGILQKLAKQFVSHLRRNLRHVAATAVRLQRKVHHLRADGFHQFVQFGRILGVGQFAANARAGE